VSTLTVGKLNLVSGSILGVAAIAVSGGRDCVISFNMSSTSWVAGVGGSG
jgi:hypothetical protein